MIGCTAIESYTTRGGDAALKRPKATGGIQTAAGSARINGNGYTTLEIVALRLPRVEPPLLEMLQSLEADPLPMGVLRLLSAEVLPLGALLVCWDRTYRHLGTPCLLWADVPPL
jgi:hypothetical protein